MAAAQRGSGLVGREQLAPFAFGHAEWPTLVFVNGGSTPRALGSVGQLPPGVRVTALPRRCDRTARCSSATWRGTRRSKATRSPRSTPRSCGDGALRAGRGRGRRRAPVHLLFVTTSEAGGTVGAPAQPDRGGARRAGRRWSRATSGSAGADLLHQRGDRGRARARARGSSTTRLQRESERAFHVGHPRGPGSATATIASFTLAMGGALARHNLHVPARRRGQRDADDGLYLGAATQHVDNQTRSTTPSRTARSRELYKGILDGRSHGVFNGKVFVQPEAQKTDAKQTNNNLLLSRRRAGRHQAAARDLRRRREVHARRDGRPLDEEALFYLRIARHREPTARAPAHLRLRRRGGGRSDAGAGARADAGASGSVPAAAAREAATDEPHDVRTPPAVDAFDVERGPRGLPDPRAAGPRQAAGLPRQRRHRRRSRRRSSTRSRATTATENANIHRGVH